jgi:hypothetical protein
VISVLAVAFATAPLWWPSGESAISPPDSAIVTSARSVHSPSTEVIPARSAEVAKVNAAIDDADEPPRRSPNSSTGSSNGPEQTATSATVDMAGVRYAEALQKAKVLAAGSGRLWPDSTTHDTDSARREVVAAYDRWAADISKIDEARIPLVEAIADAKFERGATEILITSRDVPAHLSGAERTAWIAAARDQRKPTKPRQTVVRRGTGGTTWLARVDADEDVRLQAAYDLIEAANTRFLEYVLLLSSTTNK